MDIFDNISPFDYRYYGRSKKTKEALMPYLSENALIDAMLHVELALVKALNKEDIAPKSAVKETEEAIKKVKAEDVYAEEDRIKHNVRALVNCIRKNVSDDTKPFIHFSATSHDVICSAEAYRYKKFAEKALVPLMKDLLATLISLAIREKSTIQIGRTHGQHAEPITFGFTIAEYVSRFAKTIDAVQKSADNLRGKMAGPVGAYNATTMFVKNPIDFEKNVMAELDILPSDISTQVVEQEYVLDFVYHVVKSFGVLANLSDDMRHLQRSEIAEVGEVFEADQVGSSTMPQKRNPINFENVKSMWKATMPRILTVFMDQISEHQRDLTNSASSRFVPEILAGFYVSVQRLDRVMSKLVVDKESMEQNFASCADMISAEPLYILLASQGHPNAHEHVRKMTLKSQMEKKTIAELIKEDESLRPYLDKLSKEQLKVLEDPKNYTGQCEKKTEKICSQWAKHFALKI